MLGRDFNSRGMETCRGSIPPPRRFLGARRLPVGDEEGRGRTDRKPQPLTNDPGRTRTCNPRLRRPMPYPLGHGARCLHGACDAQYKMQIVWGYFGATLNYIGVTRGLPWGYPGATLGLFSGYAVGLPSSRWKRQPIYKHSKQRLRLLLMPPRSAVV